MLRVVGIGEEGRNPAWVWNQLYFGFAELGLQKQRMRRAVLDRQGSRRIEYVGDGFESPLRVNHDSLRVDLVDGK